MWALSLSKYKIYPEAYARLAGLLCVLFCKSVSNYEALHANFYEFLVYSVTNFKIQGIPWQVYTYLLYQ